MLRRFLSPALAAVLAFGLIAAAPGAFGQGAPSSAGACARCSGTAGSDSATHRQSPLLPRRHRPARRPGCPTETIRLRRHAGCHGCRADRPCTFTAYDLDVHLTPATAAISVRAEPYPAQRPARRRSLALVLRHYLLHSLGRFFHSALPPRPPLTPLPFATHLVETDADHTGVMSEAVVTLAHPLAPGASIALTALSFGGYSGLRRTAGAHWGARQPGARGRLGLDCRTLLPTRLQRGDGPARLRQCSLVPRLPRLHLVSRRRRAASSRLLGLPNSASLPRRFACGLRLSMWATRPTRPSFAGSAASSSPSATTPTCPPPRHPESPPPYSRCSAGLHRLPARPASLSPGQRRRRDNSAPPQNPGLIAAITGRADALPAYVAAATQVEPLLTDWFGAQPLTALTIVDHPGQPFEDDALLVRPMAAVDPATLIQPLAHSLTHAWIHSSRPWIDEGLAEFVSLLWTERTQGRAAVLAALQESARALAIAEPEDPDATPNPASSSSSVDSPAQSSSSSSQPNAPAPFTHTAGASLADATGKTFYRTKAAAVWWMLRGASSATWT